MVIIVEMNRLTGNSRGRWSNFIYRSRLGTYDVLIKPGKRKKGKVNEIDIRNTFGQDSWDLLYPIKQVLKWASMPIWAAYSKIRMKLYLRELQFTEP